MNGEGWEDVPQSAVADIKLIYVFAFRFCVVAPLLFLIPVVGEFAQHVVEIEIGMYQSSDKFKQLSMDPNRFAIGVVKLLLLFVPLYYYGRYLAFKGDKSRYHDFSWTSVAPFLPVFVFNAGLSVLLLGMTVWNPDSVWSLVIRVLTFLLTIYLTYWMVTQALNVDRGSWSTSFSRINGHFWRVVGYMLAASLPLMIVHYAVGYLAIGMEGFKLWLTLILDSLVVGLLALCLVGVNYFGARWAKHASSRGMR